MAAIVVFGNIASGKTSIRSVLENHLPHFTSLCIDDYRKELVHRYDLSLIKREQLAEELCLNAVSSSRNVIFESTLMNKFWPQMLFAFEQHNHNQLYIRLDCPIDTCITRYKKRLQERGTEFRLPFASGPIDNLIRKWQLSFSPSVTPKLLIDTTLPSSDINNLLNYHINEGILRCFKSL